jgi:hypothetical protein
MATVTSSRRRNERGSGSKKVAASTPKPRQTSVGNRGAQQGPLKPGTRTSNVSTPPTRSAGRMMGGAMKGAGEAMLYTTANAALSPLARKAGSALGKALRPAARALDNRLPGINSKDELRRKTAASKAAMKSSPKQGPSVKATAQAFDKKTFDQAFKAARTSGAKVFTWRGNKYNTKLRGEK